MKFKLDENLDVRLAPLLKQGGHEVDTVAEESLGGRPDDVIYQACRSGGLTLITLDLDFSNPLRFPPAGSEGIVVIRPPRPVLSLIRETLLSALPDLQSGFVSGKLWIVEPGRIRIFDPQEELPTP